MLEIPENLYVQFSTMLEKKCKKLFIAYSLLLYTPQTIYLFYGLNLKGILMLVSVMMQNYSVKCSGQDDQISRPSTSIHWRSWNCFKQQCSLQVFTYLAKFDLIIFKFEPDKFIFYFILCYSMTKDGNSRFYHGRVSTATGTALIFISLGILPTLLKKRIDIRWNLHLIGILPFRV